MIRALAIVVAGVCGLWCGAAFGAAPAAQAHPPYRIMLLDGQNNHDWKSTTPMIRSALSESGLFTVSVVTTPPGDAAPEAWEKFRLDFKAFDAVVSNFTDFGVKPAPREFLDALTGYVRDGGALVAVHAATSGSDDHEEFAKMMGLGWRDMKRYPRVHVDDAGRTIRTPAGQGPATAHGRPFRWVVTMRAMEHPVCAGLPAQWLHETDELWAAPRGPAEDLEVLATAVAPETKQNEPVMWTVRYGKGRVFVTLLGHDAAAMRCVGFRHTLNRGLEWAIMGKVSQRVPEGFPTKEKISAN